jgi:thioredoxin-dependent peroxiredoxin
MDGLATIFASVCLLAITAGRIQAQPASELTPGDQAPAFSLPGSDGKTYRLEDFRGKQAVVLAWFPKAFTGG